MSEWTMGGAYVILFAAFRCSCGRLCAMGNQLNGNSAMVHEQPLCDRFTALLLRSQLEAIDYFESLESVALTAEVEETLQRSANVN